MRHHTADGSVLGHVASGGAGGMRIDIVNLTGLQACAGGAQGQSTHSRQIEVRPRSGSSTHRHRQSINNFKHKQTLGI